MIYSSVDIKKKKAYAVFQSRQAFDASSNARYIPNVRINVAADYEIDSDCNVSITNVNFAPDIKTGEIENDEVDEFYIVYAQLHEKDHQARIEKGGFPYLAFLDTSDNENIKMLELFEGAAVYAQNIKSNFKKEMGSLKYYKNYFFNTRLRIQDVGDVNFIKAHFENAPLYGTGKTYWDAYNTYVKEREAGFKNEYNKFAERIEKDMKEMLIQDIAAKNPCTPDDKDGINNELLTGACTLITIGFDAYKKYRAEKKEKKKKKEEQKNSTPSSGRGASWDL